MTLGLPLLLEQRVELVTAGEDEAGIPADTNIQ
jgi:hypothetical protein